ncbi:chloride channel protein [Sorangium sp. So ce315]|uniref:chloride channel protein n=1 Tax=Sorangium sp. So ce315 TaxID=3133299 RepID=UPI003F6379B7
MIQAFHHHGGRMRKRVAWVKALASILTLGSGGAGGREAPTMQVGGALGSAWSPTRPSSRSTASRRSSRTRPSTRSSRRTSRSTRCSRCPWPSSRSAS